MTQRNSWTEDQLYLLGKMSKGESDETIARVFGRTQSAIWNKRFKMRRSGDWEKLMAQIEADDSENKEAAHGKQVSSRV